MARRIETKSLTIAAITIALTVAIAPYPFVFMLPMVFTCATRGLKMSLFMGLAFGVTSLMYALFQGGSVLAIAFISQPWIPIIPRIMVAFLAHGSFVITRRLIKPDTKVKFFIPYIVCGIVAALSNTALVLTSLVLFASTITFEGVNILELIPVFFVYGAIELAFYAIAVPTVAVPVEIAVNNKRLPKALIKKENKPILNEEQRAN